jgi:hypothetical protein
MPVLTRLTLFVGSLTLLLGAATPKARTAPARPQPDYERDSRVTRKSVMLSPAIEASLEAVIQQLQDACGVPLYCQQALARTPVALVLRRERRASEIMRGLATVSEAQWVRVRGSYVLCRIPELAPLILADPTELGKQSIEGLKDLLAALSPGQRSALLRGEKLGVERLTLPQRQRVLGFVAGLLLRDGEGGWFAGALTGEGVSLGLHDGKIAVWVPYEGVPTPTWSGKLP